MTSSETLVLSKENPDFLGTYSNSETANQSSLNATIYWNGSNEEGYGGGSGVYRVGHVPDVRKHYRHEQEPVQRPAHVAKIGIQRWT